MEKVTLVRYKNTDYTVNYENKRYFWAGSRGNIVSKKDVPLDVYEWLAMNTYTLRNGELVLDKSTRVFREHLAVEFSQLVYDGRWFTRLREILLAAADNLAKDVNGKVVVKLYKGNIEIIQKDSPNSLFNFDFVTFGADEVYSQADC